MYKFAVTEIGITLQISYTSIFKKASGFLGAGKVGEGLGL